MELFARIARNPGGTAFIGRLARRASIPPELRASEILAMDSADEALPEGFRGGVAWRGNASKDGIAVLPDALSYLQEGDILKVDEPRGTVRVLYRKGSRHNVLFMTERCNSRCLMCSQPPRDSDDSWLVAEILESIPLMDPETPVLCITGGEPTLAGEGFFEVVEATRIFLPATSLHVLSNGRAFESLALADRLGNLAHPDLMVGVPLYADVACVHDFVVQARGAYDQTVRGMMNLARCGVPVECRFVIHRQTVGRMAETARFIGRNLPFVAHVALMGLEMTGFTRTNLEALWIDPFDYRGELLAAVEELQSAGVRVMIYNLPLCVLPEELWDYSARSISDWKNVYMPECGACAMKESCCGFFASAALRHTAHVRPFSQAPSIPSAGA